MEVTRKSAVSGITRTRDLDITAEQVANWTGGALIQDAFPNLSADDREFLMTGITGEEWEEEFGERPETFEELPAEIMGVRRGDY